MEVHPRLQELALEVLRDENAPTVYDTAHDAHTKWVARRAQLHAENKLPPESDPDTRTPDEAATDALAHYVFNTLRSHHDDIAGVTLDDIKALVEQLS